MQHDPSKCTCPCHVNCVHRRESEASSRGGKEKADEPCTEVLVMIRFAENMHQRYINGISARKSILKCYGGDSYGVVDNIKIMGGSGWADGYLVGLAVFKDERGAYFWYRSDEFCNQQDWLDSADIICIPLLQPIKEYPNNRTTLVMGNFFVNDEVCFEEKFVNVAKREFEARGSQVIADCKPRKFHGNWNAGRLYLVQLPDEAACHQANNSDEMKNASDVCEKTSCGCRILMQTNTNMPATPSYQKPYYC